MPTTKIASSSGQIETAESPQIQLTGRVGMRRHKFPSLYQLNTRVLLRDLSRELKRQATLNDVPDSLLDRLARAGFDWLWFLGVWQTGAAGRRVSREHHEWQTQFGLERFLPQVPAFLVAVALGIVATRFFGLQSHGVEIVGHIPQGSPLLHLLISR